MKRRLLYASAQAYRPGMEVHGRAVAWLAPPTVISREVPVAHRTIDLAMVGRVADGVVIAFRGSLPPFFGEAEDGWAVVLDWLNDGLSVCVADPAYPGGVHLGFADSMRRLWNDTASGEIGVASAIQRELARGARPHLFLTGHSKGGALANLAAWRAASDPRWRDLPVSVATIAAARAGNATFARAYAASRIACLRYEAPGDLVPHLPPGPETPHWVNTIVGALVPGLAAQDYHAVGLRMGPLAAPATRGGRGAGRWPGSRRRGLAERLLGRRGAGLAGLLPSVLAAHAICPDSGYDRLVCTGEDGCTHGEAGRARG